jgi:hypothetical protein
MAQPTSLPHGSLLPMKAFISYSRDSDNHADRVLALADALREDGVDVVIDQYHPAPDEGWPMWMEGQIDGADFVLMVCTETYLRKIKERKSSGVLWEANLIYNHLFEGPAGSRFIPILFEDGNSAHIPRPVKAHARYCLKDFEVANPQYEALLRHLLDRPATPAREVGTPPDLPEKPRPGRSPRPR